MPAGDRPHTASMLTAFRSNPDPRSSFHTWSTHSSPDHSPTNSGLDTPSPTLYTQEELETSYNAAYADAGNASHGNGHGSPQTIVNPQHQFQTANSCHHQIYSQRSLSLPNVSAQPSPSNRSAVVTPQSIPASLPQYPLPSAQMHNSFDHVFGTNTNHQYSPPPPSPYDAINMQQQQLSAQDTNTLFDIPSHYQQTLSEVDINQQLSALYATAPTSDSPPPMHVYTQGTHASNQATQQRQLSSPLDTFNATSLEATSGYTSSSGLVFPASLLEHAGAQVQQGHYLERAPYGGGHHQREQQHSGAYASTPSESSPLSWGSPTSSGSSALPQGQLRPSPSPSNYGGFEYYEWSQQ